MSNSALIIGAGPAGLMAAERLLAQGAQVQIFDAKPSIGRKFLMAGKSGLNLTKNEPLAIFQNQYYESICMKMLKKIIPNIDYPSAYSNWLNVLMNYSEEQKELGICGENALEYLSKINREYHPNLIIAGANRISELPFLKDRYIENEMLK